MANSDSDFAVLRFAQKLKELCKERLIADDDHKEMANHVAAILTHVIEEFIFIVVHTPPYTAKPEDEAIKDQFYTLIFEELDARNGI